MTKKILVDLVAVVLIITKRVKDLRQREVR